MYYVLMCYYSFNILDEVIGICIDINSCFSHLYLCIMMVGCYSFSATPILAEASWLSLIPRLLSHRGTRWITPTLPSPPILSIQHITLSSYGCCQQMTIISQYSFDLFLGPWLFILIICRTCGGPSRII